MRVRLVLILLTATLLCSACATSEKSILLGSGSGMAVGAGFGALAGGEKGALAGALIGGVAGGFVGYEAYQGKKKRDDDRDRAAGKSGSRPHLRPAQVRVKFVEDQIKDNTFIPAHFEYEITEGARWEP